MRCESFVMRVLYASVLFSGGAIGATKRRVATNIWRIPMNKKTILLAAFALLATSSLASARTVHTTTQNAADPNAASQPMDPNEAAFLTSPFQAPYGNIGGLETVQSFNHPGDNDSDPYLVNK